MSERSIVLAEATDDSARSRGIRSQLSADGKRFRVFLIGKDGNAAISSDEPVSAEYLFQRVDAMPMRKDEMRRTTLSPAAEPSPSSLPAPAPAIGKVHLERRASAVPTGEGFYRSKEGIPSMDRNPVRDDPSSLRVLGRIRTPSSYETRRRSTVLNT